MTSGRWGAGGRRQRTRLAGVVVWASTISGHVGGGFSLWRACETGLRDGWRGPSWRGCKKGVFSEDESCMAVQDGSERSLRQGV